ncbi:hypothetical protein [Pseudoneobacillus sp. C159]
MDNHDEKVEVSYQVISETEETLTVAFFIDNQLFHIVSGERGIMIEKLTKLFGQT